MELSDSRKRPLDASSECGVPKKSNPGMPEEPCTEDNVHLKVLVPSIAAGAIIGKGGETISDKQHETGAAVKMSKANDFYPGTSERVCLITGPLEGVRKLHNFIMEKIREKPDHQVKSMESSENRAMMERHKQVKILVPNTTAGRIIGKNGIQVREIKETTGAYIQLSQKSKEMNLPERCITIAGSVEECQRAIDMILEKVMLDPQSGSCPNISYADYKGPVASANPTGSPFATGGGGMEHHGPPNAFNNIGNGINNLKLTGNMGAMNPAAVETMRMTLRGTGYGEQAIDEIITAVVTLAKYGLFGFSVNLGGLGLQPGAEGGSSSMLSNLASIVQNSSMLPDRQGGMDQASPNYHRQNFGGNHMGASPISDSQVFGPLGSTTTSGKLPGDGKMMGSGFGTDPLIGLSLNGTTGFQGPNENSFGLGPGVGGSGLTGSGNINPEDNGEVVTKELEVGEHIIGAVLGQGGRGVVEVQAFTGTTIQISKKGVFAPGTRNRVVSITGGAQAIYKAEQMIQHRIMMEEAKRARNMNQ